MIQLPSQHILSVLHDSYPILVVLLTADIRIHI